MGALFLLVFIGMVIASILQLNLALTSSCLFVIMKVNFRNEISTEQT
jgi:hypothetical protein